MVPYFNEQLCPTFIRCETTLASSVGRGQYEIMGEASQKSAPIVPIDIAIANHSRLRSRVIRERDA